jgi:hypothetical protein
MLFAIARERQRREFDPLLATVRQALAAGRGAGGLAAQRLAQMEQLVGTMNLVAEKLLGDEEQARALLGFLAGGSPPRP